jgi:hypothetical protein
MKLAQYTQELLQGTLTANICTMAVFRPGQEAWSGRSKRSAEALGFLWYFNPDYRFIPRKVLS